MACTIVYLVGHDIVYKRWIKKLNYNVCDNGIEKRKCHHPKNLSLFEYLDIVNITVSSMVSSGENYYIYFTGYKDNDYEIKILGIMLQKQVRI